MNTIVDATAAAPDIAFIMVSRFLMNVRIINTIDNNVRIKSTIDHDESSVLPANGVWLSSIFCVSSVPACGTSLSSIISSSSTF
ncbi:hypothetical protein [Longibaculum muris]|uniref:hypothetical protein n=1 Tax=Longibaculum muris TaxID=1796628 RepID=UPI0022E79B8D|nr:hypothetical protein [Longibaculum muris]